MPATMTMVRSRTAPTEDAISFPVLTHSDALPRTDLRNIDEKNKAQKNQKSLAQFQFPCPQVGDQRSRRNGPPGTIATFDFRVTAPNRLWVADLTRLVTGEGVLWLASIRDAFANRIVGWATDPRATTELVLTALSHALSLCAFEAQHFSLLHLPPSWRALQRLGRRREQQRKKQNGWSKHHSWLSSVGPVT